MKQKNGTVAIARAVNKEERPQPDWVQFDKLCAMQATKGEIAAWFGHAQETIEKMVLREWGMSFVEYFALKSAPGKIALRRKQFQVAMTGQTTMLIWLGKQWLGQQDRTQIEATQTITATAAMSDDELAEKGRQALRLLRPEAEDAMRNIPKGETH